MLRLMGKWEVLSMGTSMVSLGQYRCLICGLGQTTQEELEAHLNKFHYKQLAQAASKDKQDTDKDRWDLMPWEALRKVLRVFMFGARKYEDHGWRKVENGRQRYLNAAMRHLVAYASGETKDPETGESHLAHAGCSVLIALALEGGK